MQAGPTAVALDRVFSAWTLETPGCAVGVAQGTTIQSRAFGLADLERGVPIRPDTIFEAGSVAKQFTAAAVLLLARDGRLSLDDPARKYLPEIPDYGHPLTIRHMLHHTSGLRDWGSVAAVGGWPRGSRVYGQDHVLEIAARQRGLNFPPGTRWSYTNTGYNLAVLIVERVSGLSFDAFTKSRIFDPLGMSRTSWRSDYTRITRDRALAYSRENDGFHLATPIENAIGNGGLLTTVGDLLKWNANFVRPGIADASFFEEMQEPGLFDNGRSHSYGLGLAISSYKGAREIGHDGATGGYTAHLLRLPDQQLSVAVLCNVSTAVAPRYAHEVADLFLSGLGAVQVSGPTPPNALTAAEAEGITGLYRSTLTGQPARLSAEGGSVRVDMRGFGFPLTPLSPTRFAIPFGGSWEFDGPGAARMIDSSGLVEGFERIAPARPTTAQLRELVGTYVSDEAEASFLVEVNDEGVLAIRRRPSARFVLAPEYSDVFSNAELGLVVFHREAGGIVAALSVRQDRLWDLRFIKVPSLAP
jgi:CubicO group peptidase (beta-lactamase class C family)